MFSAFSKYTYFGVIGFLIDYSIFNLLYFVTGVNFFSRGISYLCATIITWYFNTSYTFNHSGVDRLKIAHFERSQLRFLAHVGEIQRAIPSKNLQSYVCKIGVSKKGLDNI